MPVNWAMIRDMTKNLKYKYVCGYCGKEGLTNIANKKLCSKDCKANYYGRVKSGLNISSASVGAMSEMIVCADLLRKGYAVFRSVSASCFCDVIAIKDNEIRKIEIRTGYKVLDGSGRIFFPRILHLKKGTPTEYAVYSQGENKVYYEPVKKEDIVKYSKNTDPE